MSDRELELRDLYVKTTSSCNFRLEGIAQCFDKAVVPDRQATWRRTSPKFAPGFTFVAKRVDRKSGPHLGIYVLLDQDLPTMSATLTVRLEWPNGSRASSMLTQTLQLVPGMLDGLTTRVTPLERVQQENAAICFVTLKCDHKSLLRTSLPHSSLGVLYKALTSASKDNLHDFPNLHLCVPNRRDKEGGLTAFRVIHVAHDALVTAVGRKIDTGALNLTFAIEVCLICSTCSRMARGSSQSLDRS